MIPSLWVRKGRQYPLMYLILSPFDPHLPKTLYIKIMIRFLRDRKGGDIQMAAMKKKPEAKKAEAKKAEPKKPEAKKPAAKKK